MTRLDHLVNQVFLLLLKLVHFILHCALRDEADDLHDIFLSDAVSAVGCLLLDSRVPPES